MKGYVKSKDIKMYKKLEFDREEASKAAKRIQKRKTPTSVALLPETIAILKKLAQEKGIPYQVLMRSFILQGIKKEKKVG